MQIKQLNRNNWTVSIDSKPILFLKKLLNQLVTLKLLLLLQPFYGSWTVSRTTRVSRYQKGKTRKESQSGFIGARDSEWQWHHLVQKKIK